MGDYRTRGVDESIIGKQWGTTRRLPHGPEANRTENGGDQNE